MLDVEQVLPSDIFIQLRDLNLYSQELQTTRDDLSSRLKLLTTEVSDCLAREGIIPGLIESRVKKREATLAKIARRYNDKVSHEPWFCPMDDIFAMRMTVAPEQVFPTAELIRDSFPAPEIYPWGLKSFNDFTTPQNRPSPHSSPDYKAIHFCLPFTEDRIAKLVEIQLMTPSWYEVAMQTRAGYEARRSVS